MERRKDREKEENYHSLQAENSMSNKTQKCKVTWNVLRSFQEPSYEVLLLYISRHIYVYVYGWYMYMYIYKKHIYYSIIDIMCVCLCVHMHTILGSLSFVLYLGKST